MRTESLIFSILCVMLGIPQVSQADDRAVMQGIMDVMRTMQQSGGRDDPHGKAMIDMFEDAMGDRGDRRDRRDGRGESRRGGYGYDDDRSGRRGQSRSRGRDDDHPSRRGEQQRGPRYGGGESYSARQRGGVATPPGGARQGSGAAARSGGARQGSGAAARSGGARQRPNQD